MDLKKLNDVLMELQSNGEHVEGDNLFILASSPDEEKQIIAFMGRHDDLVDSLVKMCHVSRGCFDVLRHAVAIMCDLVSENPNGWEGCHKNLIDANEGLSEHASLNQILLNANKKNGGIKS